MKRRAECQNGLDEVSSDSFLYVQPEGEPLMRNGTSNVIISVVVEPMEIYTLFCVFMYSIHACR